MTKTTQWQHIKSGAERRSLAKASNNCAHLRCHAKTESTTICPSFRHPGKTTTFLFTERAVTAASSRAFPLFPPGKCQVPASVHFRSHPPSSRCRRGCSGSVASERGRGRCCFLGTGASALGVVFRLFSGLKLCTFSPAPRSYPCHGPAEGKRRIRRTGGRDNQNVSVLPRCAKKIQQPNQLSLFPI